MEIKEIYNKLTNSEKIIFNYLCENKEKLIYMSIRDIAQATNLSSASVLRTVQKLGFENFNDFKVRLKQEDKNKCNPQFNLNSELVCLKYLESDIFKEKISEAAQVIESNEVIIFEGIGNSASSASYGARILSNLGLFSIFSDDPFANVERLPQKTVVIFCSVSGESRELVNKLLAYKEKGIDIVAICANSASTIGELADICLDYRYYKKERKNNTFDFSTQIPVIYILEQITQMLSEMLQNVTKQKK